MPEMFTIRIRKEALKFASSHMTVFPTGKKEALHGHHYVPTVTVVFRAQPSSLKRFESMTPFSEIKLAMKSICAKWDEKFLIATENPFYKLCEKNQTSIQFTLCEKNYLLPVDEVELLPIANVTCEELAFYFSQLLKENLPLLSHSAIQSWSVEIEESPGQSAIYTHEAKGPSA